MTNINQFTNYLGITNYTEMTNYFGLTNFFAMTNDITNTWDVTNVIQETNAYFITNTFVNTNCWTNITTASVQAQAYGCYLANSPSQVVITLPVTPNIGDTYQVSGIGTGGWKFAQNTGQSISTLNLPLWSNNWTATSAPSQSWYSITSSADGTRLAAVVQGGQIYTSVNAGTNWTATSAPSSAWNSIASSADGTRLAAVETGGLIYTSVDAGTNWTASSAPSEAWQAIASSADGTRLAAAVQNGGGIYTLYPTYTTIGTNGYLSGGQNAFIDLEYIGNNIFVILSYVGNIFAQ